MPTPNRSVSIDTTSVSSSRRVDSRLIGARFDGTFMVSTVMTLPALLPMYLAVSPSQFLFSSHKTPNARQSNDDNQTAQLFCNSKTHIALAFFQTVASIIIKYAVRFVN